MFQKDTLKAIINVYKYTFKNCDQAFRNIRCNILNNFLQLILQTKIFISGYQINRQKFFKVANLSFTSI